MTAPKEWPRIYQVKSAVSQWERRLYQQLAKRRDTSLSELIRECLSQECVNAQLISAEERVALLEGSESEEGD